MVEKILGMRQIALETTEGALEVDANVWFETQSANMEALTRMERDMVGALRVVVSNKMAATRQAVRVAKEDLPLAPRQRCLIRLIAHRCALLRPLGYVPADRP